MSPTGAPHVRSRPERFSTSRARVGRKTTERSVDHKDLKYAISAAFGQDSEEARSYDRMVDEIADRKAEQAVAQEPIEESPKSSTQLPGTGEIVRATLTYYLARMGFIIGVWFFAAILVISLIIAGWVLIDPPGWETVRVMDHSERLRK